MERRKLTKEDLDKVRHIEGFPIGKDEDIIALSDAPYYTACPNPFIEEFIRENGTPYDEETDDYHREPFAADVSEGKNDPIYMAHSYHTKVPHRAIMRYIEHYTKPGDVVFDGFCGTGMTGVAAQACGEAKISDYSQMSLLDEKRNGVRATVLCDLSPAATFIASHYNLAYQAAEFEKEAKHALELTTQECAWMFETQHVDTNGIPVVGIDGKPIVGKVNYSVLSDVFVCPNCSQEIVFWDAAVDNEHGKVKEKFTCPNCGVVLSKRDCERAKVTYYDDLLEQIVTASKQVPVLINYSVEGKRYEKRPDAFDAELERRIEKTPVPYWVPIELMAGKGAKWGDTWRAGYHFGITHVHQFYTRRNLITLSAFYEHAKGSSAIILIQSVSMVNTKMYRYRWAGGFAGAGGGPLAGTLYVPSIIKDISILKSLSEYTTKTTRAKSFLECFPKATCISTQSSTSLQMPNNSVDYIFTDPPFGDNLNYSELSFIWEAWLKVKTNNECEAIINESQKKSLNEYQSLMEKCFHEFYRILKPNRWITIEFHNSRNAVWTSIQEALQRVGFIIADVRTLDKKQGSFKQVTTTSAVKQDLVISAYKPKISFQKEILESAGTNETAWQFVRQHLENIPVVVANRDRIELVAERQAFLLFDRMVAYHIMHGIPVPMDAADFYRGLDERFLKRDGMYFLPEQVNKYDQARIENDLEDVQLSFAVSNEKTAISWLYVQLETPQTYAELQPKFMQEVRSIDKFEAMPELSVLLEENFLQREDGKWYIPDITKEADMAKLREKSLLKEFDSYLATKGKLKLFRSEAIRAGFARLWKEKNYRLIVETAERLPEKVIQEDDKLLMYYDISLGRV